MGRTSPFRGKAGRSGNRKKRSIAYPRPNPPIDNRRDVGRRLGDKDSRLPSYSNAWVRRAARNDSAATTQPTGVNVSAISNPTASDNAPAMNGPAANPNRF